MQVYRIKGQGIKAAKGSFMHVCKAMSTANRSAAHSAANKKAHVQHGAEHTQQHAERSMQSAAQHSAAQNSIARYGMQSAAATCKIENSDPSALQATLTASCVNSPYATRYCKTYTEFIDYGFFSLCIVHYNPCMSVVTMFILVASGFC